MRDSTIQWTTSTFNPWIGCSKISPGCVGCYAEKQNRFFRWARDGWGAGKQRRRTSASNWQLPIRWDRAASQAGKRPRVFCGSLCDWLDEEVPTEWRRDLLDLVGATPSLDWMLLTKRPGLWRQLVEEAAGAGSALAARWLVGEAPPNVWLGATVEDRPRAEERIPQLLAIPAAVRFLSCEPLLEPIGPDLDGVDLVICGGESGGNARPFDIEWARQLRDRCRDAGVSFFMKQCGSRPVENGRAMKLRDDHGGDPDEWPEDLRVRELPEALHQMAA